MLCSAVSDEAPTQYHWDACWGHIELVAWDGQSPTCVKVAEVTWLEDPEQWELVYDPLGAVHSHRHDTMHAAFNALTLVLRGHSGWPDLPYPTAVLVEHNVQLVRMRAEVDAERPTAAPAAATSLGVESGGEVAALLRQIFAALQQPAATP